MIFTIDKDNNITAHETATTVQDGLIAFATEKKFTKATAEWPIGRLVETWNSFAGTPGFDDLKPVKKFENKTKATKRIWDAIQVLVPTGLSPAAGASIQAPAACAALAAAGRVKKAPQAAKPAKAPEAPKAKAPKAKRPAGEPKAPREGSKMAQVITMIQKKGGATLEAIQKETGWAKHYADVRIMPTCVGNPVCGAGIAAMESA
jgi:hypothetical protein